MKLLREVISGSKSLIVGMRLTIQEFFKPTITVHYPHQTIQMPERYRGHIELKVDPETGAAACTACNLCARACPSDCISVDGAKLEGAKKKSVTDYHLDFTKCSLCGACIEACPSDAIQFTKRYNIASTVNEYNNMDLVQRFLKQHPQSARAAAPVPSAPAPAAPQASAPVSQAPAAPAAASSAQASAVPASAPAAAVPVKPAPAAQTPSQP